MTDLQRPSQIGRYEIRREIGRGMMGVVYEAHDPALGRTIALKTIHLGYGASARAREEFERRFLAEARIAARLSHPGIVVVHDVGRDAERGILYIALEYLQGRTLAEMAGDDSRLDWRESLRIVGRVAEALDYAHGQGVVHRDIKPANIMVVRSGEPKILDFGIARVDTSQMTTTGQFFGTPLYMSPEQALGQPLDGRADLFSLGSVAYTLLVGRAPFDGPNVPGILARVAYQHPKVPSQVAPDLPADLDYVLARALAKVPADRYPQARALAEDVEDVREGRPPRHRNGWNPPDTGEATLATSGDASLLELPRTLPPAVRARKRRRAPAISLVLLLLLTTALYFYLRPSDRRFWQRAWDAVVTARNVLARAARLEPAPEPARLTVVTIPTPAPPAATPSSAPPAARPGEEERAAAPVAAVEPTPLPADPPSPLPAAAPTPAEPAPLTSPLPGPGTLSIEFEHHLRRGNLQLWVDDERVLDEDFDGRVTRKILALRFRKGRVQEVLTLPAGRHEVRVQVSWDDNLKFARITGTFQPGATRRLKVQVGRIGGNLSLHWK